MLHGHRVFWNSIQVLVVNQDIKSLIPKIFTLSIKLDIIDSFWRLFITSQFFWKFFWLRFGLLEIKKDTFPHLVWYFNQQSHTAALFLCCSSSWSLCGYLNIHQPSIHPSNHPSIHSFFLSSLLWYRPEFFWPGICLCWRNRCRGRCFKQAYGFTQIPMMQHHSWPHILTNQRRISNAEWHSLPIKYARRGVVNVV